MRQAREGENLSFAVKVAPGSLRQARVRESEVQLPVKVVPGSVRQAVGESEGLPVPVLVNETVGKGREELVDSGGCYVGPPDKSSKLEVCALRPALIGYFLISGRIFEKLFCFAQVFSTI